MAENNSRPEGVPPSQGGKYVGFGSAPPPSAPRSSSQGDVFSVVSQGLGRLSLAAASAAQSAATVVQAGTKEITSKVKEGGYDHKMNETVNVVATKTTEIGQKTWGIMKGVMAMASQKVEEFAKESSDWKGNNDWQQNETQRNGHYQDFGQNSKGWNSSEEDAIRPYKSVSSWDDWDEKGKAEPAKKGSQGGDSWAGWDDAKEDNGNDYYTHSSSNSKGVTPNGKSSSLWTEGGFL